MPQDSTYITPAGDTILLSDIPDSVREFFTTRPVQRVDSETDYPSAALVFVIVISTIIAIPLIWNLLLRIFRKQQVSRIYDNKRIVYDNILLQYIPYYKNLSTALRERFLKRTLNFKSVKNFEFVEMQEEEHMPLLISATAVQLTFGLENYTHDFFKTIYVMKSTYRFGLYNVPFEGHVNTDGIYLSWNNFLKAYVDYSDGDNVGLHEMAHALTYTNFTANIGSDEAFKERFRKFSKTGRAVFASVQAGETAFLGNYAATNYQEFWAVCVENFFERPLSFKIQLPGLYSAMCQLLNQDLLTPEILLKPVQEV